MKHKSRVIIKYVFFISIIALFASCDDESDEDKIKKEDRVKIETYLSENDIDAEEHHSGIFYEELTSNSSGQQVTEGQILNVKYSFSLLNGDTLNICNDTIVTFGHGYNYTIPYGLNIGVGLMRQGEQFRFYVPSWMAFGEYENEDLNIPFNAILICEAEIIDMHTTYAQKVNEIDSIINYIEENDLQGFETYPDELYFRLTHENENGESPEYGDLVTIHFSRKYLNGDVHYSTHDDEGPVRFRIGGNTAVRGLEEGIKLMREGEEATLILPSEIGFGASNQVLPIELRKELIEENIIKDYPTPFTPIIYEVELLTVN